LEYTIDPRDIYNGKMYGIIGSGATVEDGVRVDISNVVPSLTETSSGSGEKKKEGRDTGDRGGGGGGGERERKERTLKGTAESAFGILKTIDTEEDEGEGIATIWEREFTLLDWEGNRPFTDLDGGETVNVDEVFINGKIETSFKTDFVRVKRIPMDISELPGSRTALGKRVDPDHLRFIWSQVPSKAESGKMNMILIMKFQTPRKVGRLTITPHNFGETAFAEVKNIYLWKVDLINDDDSKGGWIRAQESANVPTSFIEDDEIIMDKTKSWILGNETVTSIKIELEQTTGYKQKYDMYAAQFGTIVSRPPDVNVVAYRVQYLVDFLGREFMSEMEDAVTAIARPELLAIRNEENQILKANKTEKIVSSALPAAIASLNYTDPGTDNPGGIIDDMIGLSLQQRGEQAFYDPGYFAGPVTIPSSKSNRYRYAIGIRNMEVDVMEYAEYSQLLSKNFVSPAPIGSIVLRTEEIIPTAFRDAESTAAQAQETVFKFMRPWITYQISVDGGNEWHPISPVNGRRWFLRSDEGKQSFQVPMFILINSGIPAERRNIYPWGPLGYIDTVTGEPPRNVMLKVLLQRPSDELGSFFTGLTPRLDSYEILVNPGFGGGTP
jgi:hypothetical protein